MSMQDRATCELIDKSIVEGLVMVQMLLQLRIDAIAGMPSGLNTTLLDFQTREIKETARVLAGSIVKHSLSGVLN